MQRGLREGRTRDRSRCTSTGNLEDFWGKRRREEEMEGVVGDEEGAFSKSRKTQRSPESNSQKETKGEEEGRLGEEKEEKKGDGGD